MRKKLIALILAAVMAVSAFGVSAMAIAAENVSSENVKIIDEKSGADMEETEEETGKVAENDSGEDSVEPYKLSAVYSGGEDSEVVKESAEDADNAGSSVTIQETGSSRSVVSEASNAGEKNETGADAEAVKTEAVNEDGTLASLEQEEVKVYVNGEEEGPSNADSILYAASSALESYEDTEAVGSYKITSYSSASSVKDNPAKTDDAGTLDVIFLLGQSNIEGQTANGFETEKSQQILCDENMIYSTVIPMYMSGSNLATGNKFSEAATKSNVKNYIASSLGSTTSLNNTTLPYKQNALSANGSGKTGPDSGIAYEWNQLTGRKVWVVNISYGGSSIGRWDPENNDLYPIAQEAINQVLNVCNKEVAAGNVKMGSTLMFWLQGEADGGMSYGNYLEEFKTLVDTLDDDFHYDGFGIISARASLDHVYTGSADLEMTAPRQAQIDYAASQEKVFMVSEVNEQWVSDSGVKNYFSSAYPNGITYAVRAGENCAQLAQTEGDVHPGIHYTQLGHNENGITAAKNMFTDLSSPPPIIVGSVVGLESVNGTLTYKENGVKTDFTGFAKYDGDWWFVKNGIVDKSRLDILEGNINGVDGWYYVENGKVNFNYTGVSNFSNQYGWWYIKNGMVDFSKTGVEQNCNGWWRVVDGKVDFNCNSVEQNDYGWWYIIGGKVQFDYTGVTNYSNQYGWWYVKDGKVDFSHTGVEKNNYGWWRVVDGKVDFGFTGIASNSYGWWYIKDGQVDFAKNGNVTFGYTTWKVTGGEAKPYNGFGPSGSDWYYYKNGSKQTSTDDIIQGTVNYTDGWYYVVNGKVDFSYTGCSNFCNQYGWWYIKNGVVDFGFTGIASNVNGNWYLSGGKVDFGKNGTYTDSSGAVWNISGGRATKASSSTSTSSGSSSSSYTGFKQDGNDWYYYKNGSKTSSNDILKGTINGTEGWYYIVNGKVDFSYTGVSNFSNQYGWWYIKNGMVDFGKTGIEQNQYGWWRVVDGQVDFSCNSVEQNDYGWWYILGGEVQFGYTGVADYANQYGWWYIKDGQVDFGFTGLASNKYGTWYVKDGKVDFSYNGTCNGKTVKGGQVV